MGQLYLSFLVVCVLSLAFFFVSIDTETRIYCLFFLSLRVRPFRIF